MVSQAELIFKGYPLWFLVLSQFVRDCMGPFNRLHKKVLTVRKYELSLSEQYLFNFYHRNVLYGSLTITKETVRSYHV